MISKKLFNLIGVCIGIIMIIIGIVIMSTPAKGSTAMGVSTATFGADFYTDEYAATRAAAINVGRLDDDMIEIGKKLAQYFGLIFIFSGILVALSYGKIFLCSSSSGEKKKSQVSLDVPPTGNLS